MLKGMVAEIVGDIMDNIRKQILQKMKSLDVIVKESLHRRASFDDYNLCFENFGKKSTMYTFGDIIGDSGRQGTQNIFATNTSQRRNKPTKGGKGDAYDDDASSSSSIFS
jgi:hypothetical protein